MIRWEIQWRMEKSQKGGRKDKQRQNYVGFVNGTKYFKGKHFKLANDMMKFYI